ncbi:hypothetical protein NPIL_606331 [Nephila pilipes]|uniref:Integrase catalytic domain-containing protein n=1 Tax=Nephila pilipes TaxID=299642 RepID=A0A8X6P2B6_NEPPI|nr:hypothetical protein NPIL_606331 [Nephila pilipes]
MLELFLQQLPTSVQTILASITPITVEKAAEVADRILEVSTPNVSLSTNAIVSSNDNRILQEIERLNKRIDDLTLRHSTPQRSNSRPRNHSFSRSSESDFCCYHNKFQERAKKCTSPCSHKQKKKKKKKTESSEEQVRLPSRNRIFHVAFSSKTDHLTSHFTMIPDLISAFSQLRFLKGGEEIDIATVQLVDDELKHLLESNSIYLTLKKQYFPLEDITLTCDVSINVSRPFTPKDYHRIVFQHLHGLSHPGIAASTKMVTQSFVGPNIRRDIKAWVKSRHPCHISKIHRHTKAPIGTFVLPDARFPQIHIDFIGPFPPSNDQSYCLTIVHRFTKWMEVIPTADMTAETICRALLSVWISRFGCPAIITTDQGTNFESNLFRELNNILGTNRIRCCAYHPKANGLIERLHRHLKSAIKAHENSKWSEIIPIVLLGMRSAVKKDIKATCAELVNGTTLRLPSDLFSKDKFTTTCNQTYVSFLREKMRSLQPIPTSAHTKSSMFVPTDLKSCSHVFLKVDSV